MSAVLLVGIDPALASAILGEPGPAAPAVERMATGCEIAARLEGAAFEVVVLGPRVQAPIQVAQRVFLADPDVGTLVIAEPARSDELALAIQFAPLVGSDVRCLTAEPVEAVCREIDEIRSRTRIRRAHRGTMAAFNAQRGQRPPPALQARAAEFMGQILDRAPLGVTALDGGGRVRAWNRAAEAMLGRAEIDVLGTRLDAFFEPAERERLARFLGGEEEAPGHGVPGIFAMIGAAGRVDVEINRSRLSAPGSEPGTLLLLLDVSAREKARRAAEEAARRKDEFLAVLSHELRTPLAAILGWARVIRHSERGPRQLYRAAEAIERNAATQIRIIEDLLDISRVVVGKLHLALQPVHLDQILRDAIAEIRPIAEANGVRLDLDAPVSPVVMGDVDRLKQVVWNLAANAIKFTQPRGSISVCLGEGVEGASFAVRDDGAGIEAAALPFVFDRFFQADSTTTRAHRGLGLGLAIVRHIVELHGGSVRAESAGAGRGATFTVTLPRLGDPTGAEPPRD